MAAPTPSIVTRISAPTHPIVTVEALPRKEHDDDDDDDDDDDGDDDDDTNPQSKQTHAYPELNHTAAQYRKNPNPNHITPHGRR